MRKRKTKWISALLIAAMLICMSPIAQVTANTGILMETALVAGQNKTVGTVTVTKADVGQLSVTYSLNAQARSDGWRIYETQLAIGKTLSDIPRAKNNSNPVPGQFPYKHSFTNGTFEFSEYINISGYAMDTTLYMAAHAVVKKGFETVLAPYGGSRVFDYDQGERYDGSNVLLSRSNPYQGLFFELGMNDTNFFSLGFSGLSNDGWLIIEFDKPITNGTGNDLRVIEDTWGLPYPVETAEVFVSQNGINWVSLGMANNQHPISEYHTISEFEFDTVGLSYVRYVKLQDRSVKADFVLKYPSQALTLDGYDVNAVLALHDYVDPITYDETAWGAGKRFTEKGNWGTYFTYTLK